MRKTDYHKALRMKSSHIKVVCLCVHLKQQFYLCLKFNMHKMLTETALFSIGIFPTPPKDRGSHTASQDVMLLCVWPARSL